MRGKAGKSQDDAKSFASFEQLLTNGLAGFDTFVDPCGSQVGADLCFHDLRPCIEARKNDGDCRFYRIWSNEFSRLALLLR